MPTSVDYLIVGSGLASLSFAALMAQKGKKIVIVEAHDTVGGYGHTFTLGKNYRFNAQLHYVWSCGEGQSINRFLKKLNLDEEIQFEHYDEDGFDHMHMPGYSLKIPNSYLLLEKRLADLFPEKTSNINQFIQLVQDIGTSLEDYNPVGFSKYFRLLQSSSLLKYLKYTLQEVFDQFDLPLEAQTLLALQWPDFLLPPNQLSFLAWVALFDGYIKGAYYPTQHFEKVTSALTEKIISNGGEINYSEKVTRFLFKGNKVVGVESESCSLDSNQMKNYYAKDVICNMDPQKAAHLIGIDKFSSKIRKKLQYDYSPSNFMAYCVVKDLDLKDFGFGKFNLFHTSQPDLNKAFYDMYHLGDYSKPSFVITTPSLVSQDESCSVDGHQLIEILTVANYDRFLGLKISNQKAYRDKKKEILNSLLDITEELYIPNLRDHLTLKVTGSPTTNEHFCLSPNGNSYGSNLTPKNMGLNRLTHKSSIDHLYFCNASSGYPGFVGTITTGARLYETLAKDHVF